MIEGPPEERHSLQSKFKKTVASLLIAQREDTMRQPREMTCAVMSRWYRSPEVILTDKTYGKGCDIWAIGCILIELIIGSKEFQDKETRYLFQGLSCFPISPKNPHDEDADYEAD